MLETLTLLVLAVVTFSLLYLYARARKYSSVKEWVVSAFVCTGLLFFAMFLINITGVINNNATADSRLASMLKEHKDIQRQIDTYTDEQALAAVMERAEEYNQEVAFGKSAAHSAWNAWSYPAKVFDNLLFVEFPEV